MNANPRSSTSPVRGMAIWIVVTVLAVAAVLVLGLFFSMRMGARQVGQVVTSVEHLYGAEAVLSTIVNRLKRAPWIERFYRDPSDPTKHASRIETGNYRGVAFVALIEDVAGAAAAPVPGLVDVFMRVDYRDTRRNVVARVLVLAGGPGQPTSTRTIRFTLVPEDVGEEAGRAKVRARIVEEEAERARSRALTETLVRRVVEEGRRTDASAVKRLVTSDERGALVSRALWRDGVRSRLQAALAALGRLGVRLLELVGALSKENVQVLLDRGDPDFEQAVDLLEALLADLGGDDAREFRQLVRYVLGRARLMWADSSTDLEKKKGQLEEARRVLKDLRAEFSVDAAAQGQDVGRDDPADRVALIPHALLDLARVLARMRTFEPEVQSELDALLKTIAEDYGDFRIDGAEAVIETMDPVDPEGRFNELVSSSTVRDPLEGGTSGIDWSSLGPEEQALISKLNSPKLGDREDAVRALRELGCIPGLVKALSDSHHKIREEAIKGLAALSSESGLIVALSDPHHKNREEAIKGLAEQGSTSGLTQALSDSHHANRELAIKGLVDAASVPGLTLALSDSHHANREIAIKGLAELKAVAPLITALGDSHPSNRELAYDALVVLSTDSSLSATDRQAAADAVAAGAP